MMNFETENPTLVKLIGAGIALASVVLGATLLKDQLAWCLGFSGTVLGIVGVTVTGKQS